MHKPTMYTMKTAEVKKNSYNNLIDHPSNAEHSFIIDDLVSIGPVCRATVGYSATMVLKFDREYNNTLTIHFPFYSIGNESREKLIKDSAFFNKNGTLPEPEDLNVDPASCHSHQDTPV